MTQRERVYLMLKNAGAKGVRSDEFFAAFMPRAGARVHELRAEGFEITSEQERQFVRYTLTSPRSSTEEQRTSKPMVAGSNPAGGSQARGVADVRTARGREDNPITTAPERSVPSMFDCDVSWESAA